MNYPRVEYEMTKEDLAAILEACRPTPVIMVGGHTGPTPQDNANCAWAVLGKKMGFDYTTVRPIEGKGQRFFTAVPSETEEQRAEREEREAEERRAEEIATLMREIGERQERVRALLDVRSD
jgi:hypothetical protein